MKLQSRLSASVSIILLIFAVLSPAAVEKDKRQLLGSGGLIDLDPSDTPTSLSTSNTLSLSSSASFTSSSSSSFSFTSTSTPTTSFPPTTSSTASSTPSTTSSSQQTSSSFSSSSQSSTLQVSQKSTSEKPVVVTTIVTRTSGTKTYASTSKATSTPSAPAAAAATSKAPNLGSADKSSNSSGLSSSSKKTIIGVVVGIGGAIAVGALGLLAWRIWGRKGDPEDDDTYDPNAVDSNREKSAGSDGTNNPFKSTLDQYHNPGSVNTASNF